MDGGAGCPVDATLANLWIHKHRHGHTFCHLSLTKNEQTHPPTFLAHIIVLILVEYCTYDTYLSHKKLEQIDSLAYFLRCGINRAHSAIVLIAYPKHQLTRIMSSYRYRATIAISTTHINIIIEYQVHHV